MGKVTLGYKFKPNVDEAFKYLRKKVYNIQEPNVEFESLKEIDVYQFCPPDHPELSKEKCTYIFTRRVAISTLSRKIDRKTKDGKGAWVMSGSDEFKMGMRHNLVYYLKGGDVKGRGLKTDWLMQEYVLHADAKGKADKTMALCRIYTRNPKECKGTDGSKEELMMIESSQEYQQKNIVAPENKELVCTNLYLDSDESGHGHDQLKNTTSAKEEIILTDFFSDSVENQQITAAPANEEIILIDFFSGGVENQQNAAAPANEKTVFTDLGSDGVENQQNTTAPANKEIVFTDSGSDGVENQQNTAAPANKEIVLTDFFSDSVENQQNTAAPANEETVFNDLGLDGIENQQNTAAPANKEIVLTDFFSDSVENQQNTAAPANEDIVFTDSGSDGIENQQNTAAPANEDIVLTDSGSDGIESSQGHDLPKNTTSAAENDVGLSLRLCTGSQN
ncbi:NAC domain-containing protein 2-like [Daucus carota subsp. sativus]|uniref:NAC domain-containing protein 2-like n=1 Tax=Daucus carota subsp. sativus TaxID=79200 RepID=UPI00308337A2